MAALSYGLNLTKKKPPSTAPSKRKALFDDDDDSDGSNPNPAAETAIDSIGGLSSPHASTKHASKPPPPPPSQPSLSTLHTTRLHTTQATALDPSIYDYDAFHTTHTITTSSRDAPSKKPRYMASLLQAAETRKRDALLAQDRLLLKERESEGDAFADKEKFVTEAYKKQQEEVRRLEAEEKEREAQEAEKRKGQGGGMRGFYKDVLERGEKRHEEVVKAGERAAKEADGKDDAEHEERKKEKTEAELAREKGALVNDEGVVVDKRQLLAAGLNHVPVKPGGKAAAAEARGTSAGGSGVPVGVQGKAAAQRAQRERQTRMMEEQLAASTRLGEEEELRKRRELEARAQSKKSEGEIEGARERYLRRKREREEEEAKKKG